MKFLVDESTGLKAARALTVHHDVVYVDDVSKGARDTDILKRALQEKRILITNDKDFGELIVRNREAHAGVIFLRLQDDVPAVRIRVIEQLIQNFGDKLYDTFTIATEKKVRMRKKEA